jgi:hypothetical protein
VRDEPGFPAAYVGFRASHRLKVQLEEAAAASDRSLSTEAQFRLEASFLDNFSEPQRHLARQLLGMYLTGGAAQLVRHVTGMPDPVTLELPDEAERKRRWQEMRDTLAEARWASPEAEDRYQRIERKVDELRAMFKAATKRSDEAA